MRKLGIIAIVAVLGSSVAREGFANTRSAVTAKPRRAAAFAPAIRRARAWLHTQHGVFLATASLGSGIAALLSEAQLHGAGLPPDPQVALLHAVGVFTTSTLLYTAGLWFDRPVSPDRLYSRVETSPRD